MMLTTGHLLPILIPPTQTSSVSIVPRSSLHTTAADSLVSRYTTCKILTLTTHTASSLYYVRGGYTDLNTGSLRSAGGNSLYWSSTTYPTATSAYGLGFNSANVFPSYDSTRFNSFSVRCISKRASRLLIDESKQSTKFCMYTGYIV